MLKVFPLTDVLVKVLTGSGECAQGHWRFLGVGHARMGADRRARLGVWGLWANLRRRPPVLQILMPATCPRRSILPAT